MSIKIVLKVLVHKMNNLGGIIKKSTKIALLKLFSDNKHLIKSECVGSPVKTTSPKIWIFHLTLAVPTTDF